MENIPLWTLLPLAAALVLALFFLGRSHSWNDPVLVSDEIEAQRKLSFFHTHRMELLLAGISIALALYFYLPTSAQQTSQIPIEPNTPGRPFYSLHVARDFLSTYYILIASISNILSGVATLFLLAKANKRRSAPMLRFALLWAGLSLAGSAQWFLGSQNQITFGLPLYLAAGLTFFMWSRLAKKSIAASLSEPQHISIGWEIILVIFILTLAAFGRLHHLQSIPYGIEGDEAKWTSEVVSLGIRGLPDPLGTYHRSALPTSFFVQTLFHKMLGPSIFAARFEVAFFSILATFIFYLLLRQITIIPIALLATWFLSASIFDISASRTAHVESHVKIWTVLTLALLTWAIRKKKWQPYAITGISLLIALLTYDTIWLLAPLALLLTSYEAWRSQENKTATVRNLVALFFPSLFSLPLLIPYLVDRMRYYNFGNRQADLASIWGYFSDVISSWYVVLSHDFFYNRTGPLLNAFLLPWMTLGLIVALTILRHRLSFWTVSWALLFIIPIPVATHSPFGRVFYPALPAVYVFIAIGMYLFMQEAAKALGRNFHRRIASIFLLILIWIPLFNFYIYFNEVEDYEDDQLRRELAELASEAANSDTLVILASIPNGNEPLNNETPTIELFMLSAIPNEQIKESYRSIATDEVLPFLSYPTRRPNLSVILDTSSKYNRHQHDNLAEAIKKCYPAAHWVEGNFFSRVDINAEAFASAACISTRLSLESVSANTLQWKLAQGTASQVSLQCENWKNIHQAIHAETLPFTPGWITETAVANDWEGSGFLMDNLGSSPVFFEFALEEAYPVYIWTRYYKRAVDNSPAKISINNQSFSFANIDEEKINQWNWERVGPFIIPAGVNLFALERPYYDEPQQFMAIFIDSLVITTNAEFIPASDPAQYLQTQIIPIAQEQKQGEIFPQLESGSYQCYVETSNSTMLVDAFGNSPVKSNKINLTIP